MCIGIGRETTFVFDAYGFGKAYALTITGMLGSPTYLPVPAELGVLSYRCRPVPRLKSSDNVELSANPFPLEPARGAVR